jgi:hypothetical protein
MAVVNGRLRLEFDHRALHRGDMDRVMDGELAGSTICTPKGNTGQAEHRVHQPRLESCGAPFGRA